MKSADSNTVCEDMEIEDDGNVKTNGKVSEREVSKKVKTMTERASVKILKYN